MMKSYDKRNNREIPDEIMKRIERSGSKIINYQSVDHDQLIVIDKDGKACRYEQWLDGTQETDKEFYLYLEASDGVGTFIVRSTKDTEMDDAYMSLEGAERAIAKLNNPNRPEPSVGNNDQQPNEK